jgi:AraC-like DNA-binding protein
MLIPKLQTTSTLYLLKLAEVLETLGISRQRFLLAAGLTPDDLADRDGHISLERYLAAVQTALDLSGSEELGFLVGEHTSTLEHGILGYALLSSATLRESLQRYQRYQSLLGPVLKVELAREGDCVMFRASPIGGYALSRAQLSYFTQEWLVGWNQWMPLIGEEGVFFTRVALGYSAGDAIGVYQHHLGCPVESAGGKTVAVFPARFLDCELDYANDTIGAICAGQCEYLRRNLGVGSGVIAEIHNFLATSPGRIPSMEEAASALSVSSRTLRRHLDREGTTYQQLVIDFRIAMAQQYLKSTALPANEIAALVGYADTANFYRTFRSAVGMTPASWRQNEAPGSANL